MAEAIVDLSRGEPPEVITADVCVIGSGCGGATAARVFAEGGRDVVVLEEGGDYTGRALTQRELEMYDQLYMDRGARATQDMSISVLQGRVLGGGGVINACDVVPMHDEVMRLWQKRYGLTDLSPERIAPYAKQALEDLGANHPRKDQVNRANRLLREGTQALGWRGEVMMHNREQCAGLGTCLIGCPVDAKQNPRFVSIPKGQAAGARYYTRARAVRIDGADREVKRVKVRRLDPKGYREQGELEVRAKVVVVAANAVATPQLLLRSGIGNEWVGRTLSLQPQLPVTALFDERVEAYFGIPQVYSVTEFEEIDAERRGLWGFRIEAIMGTPGIVASLLPLVGAEGKNLMTQYPYLASSLLLMPDAPSGRVSLTDDGRPDIRYRLDAELVQRLRRAVRATARIYLAAGAREVIVPLLPPVVIRKRADLEQIDELDFPPASAPFLSAHQQGSVRLAPSKKDGAADPTGQVFGTRDVYVMDSSGFPTSASSHTMAPIITLSRYFAEGVLAT